jgi:hypothetical protein
LIDPQIERLVPMFLITYLTAGVVLLAILGFRWYAGHVVALASGRPEEGTRAGRRCAGVGWLCWCGASLLAVVLLRADGTLSWLAATGAKLIFTPARAPITGMYVTTPDGAFLMLQVSAFLLQAGVGLAIALYCGGIAGEVGATRHRRRDSDLVRYGTMSGVRSRVRAALGATRAHVLRSRGK